MRAFAAEDEELRRYSEGMKKYVNTVWRQARLYFFCTRHLPPLSQPDDP